MGHELLYACQGETRRLLWLMGIMFAVIVAFQYLELPYNNVLSSVFSSGKVPGAEKNSLVTGDPPSRSAIVNKKTYLDGMNSTGANPVHETFKSLRVSEAEDTDLNNDLVAAGNVEGWDTDEESFTEKWEELNKNSTMETVHAVHEPAPQNGRESEQSFNPRNDKTGDNSSEVIIESKNNTTMSGNIGSSGGGALSPIPASPMMDLSSNVTLPDANIRTSVKSIDSNTSSVEKVATPTIDKNEKPLKSNLTTLGENSSGSSVPTEKKKPENPTPAVITIAEMKNMLLQNRASYRSMVCDSTFKIYLEIEFCTVVALT